MGKARRLWMSLIGAVLLTGTAPLALCRAHAQVTGAITVGTATVGQPGIARRGVMTSGLEIRARTPSTSLGANAYGVRDGSGNGSLQATALASAFLATPLRQSVVEVTAVGTTFAAERQWPVTTAQVFAAHHIPVRRGRVFYSVGSGASMWAGSALPATAASAGVSWSAGADRFDATTTLTVTQSERTVQSGTPTSPTLTREVFDVRYADVGAAWRREAGSAEFSASLSSRTGLAHVTGRSLWGSANVVAPVARGIALVIGAGRAPDDYVRGVPSTSYFSIALRAQTSSAILSRPPPRGSGPPLTIERSGDAHVISIVSPAGATVELMGDFTGWKAVTLTRAGDAWVTTQLLTPGLHRLMVRVDGGPWMVPRNLAPGTDELGGRVGLITIS
jgi:hypothetical protein